MVVWKAKGDERGLCFGPMMALKLKEVVHLAGMGYDDGIDSEARGL